MTPRENEIRQKIVAHIQKTGRCPNWQTVGTDYYEGKPIYDAMVADGTLKIVESETPTGRRSLVIRLGNSPDRVIARAGR